MLLRPLLTPLLSKLLSPLIDPAQRIFITVNGVDEYFTFQNTKTFPDDFDLSIDAVLPTAATTVTLYGQTASADHYIKVLSTGFVSINIDTSIVTSTVLATKDSKQRRYGVKLVGDDFIFTEDGATIDTVTDAVAAAKTLIINAIGQSNGTDFFNRTLSDPILKDLTTPLNSVSWQLNRDLPATTEQSTDGTNLLTYIAATRELFTFNQSDQRWVGVQLWGANIAFFSSQEQSVIDYLGVSGQYLIKTTGTSTGISSSYDSTDGLVYQLEYEIVSNLSGGLNYSDYGVIPSTVGRHTVIIDAIATLVTPYFKRQSGATDIVIKDIKVNRIIEIS